MNLKTSTENSLLVNNPVSSPLRKSQLSNIHNTINLLQHDDNAERLQRRSLIGNKVDISEMNGIRNVGEQQLIQDHFQLCVKMFVENKLNTKNVWNLKAIDYMETVLQSQLKNKNLLHIGGTSLDVCSKVYCLRVDDIYASGLQLAGSITRSDVKSTEVDNSVEEKESENHKKKNKKKSKKGTLDSKSTVVKDLKSITGNIPKLDLNYFQTRLGVDTGNTSLLFTNILQMHPISYKFLLICSQVSWVSYSDLPIKSANYSDISYIWPLKCTENELVICKAFTDLEINRWNPDENNSCIMGQSFDNLLINEKGLPVAELDGSICDSYNNDIQGLHEEDNPEVQYKIHNEPEHILTFKPENHATVCNEYSYVRCDSYINNNKNTITQMWAGPSHWKLKYIRPAASKFSGINQKQKNERRKEKATPSALNFYNCPKLPTVKYKSKKTSRVQNADRLTLPENHVQKTFTDFGIKLASKPLVIYPKNSNKMSTNLEDDLPFNYKNRNDSEYCCENNLEQNSFESEEGKNPTDEYQNDVYGNVEQMEKNENFIGENLVSYPQVVQKSFIPYALTAKKLDIRQLKNAVGKCIELENVNSSVKKNVQDAQREMIMFSNICKRVPNFISKKLKEELSVPITFVAFLHLVNEHNLKIEKHINNITDFKIKIK